MVIGIDIGYGVTKVMTHSGRVETFRTIVGVGKPDTMGVNVADSRHRVVSVNGNTYTVGEDAERFELPLINVRKRNHIESLAYKAVILSALSGLIANTGAERIKVVTGLPVRFIGDTDRLKAVYKSVLPDIEVVVIPQPAGTFFDLLLDAGGNIRSSGYAKAKLGIIDIGTYTTDILMLDNMEIVRALSGSIPIGIHSLAEQVISACADKRRDLSHTEVETAMTTGYITRFGEKINITNMINHCRASVARDIFSYVNSVWGGKEQIEVIVLTGGGSAIFSPVFKEHLSAFANVTEPSNVFLSNVYGFYKLGMRL